MRPPIYWTEADMQRDRVREGRKLASVLLVALSLVFIATVEWVLEAADASFWWGVAFTLVSVWVLLVLLIGACLWRVTRPTPKPYKTSDPWWNRRV